MQTQQDHRERVVALVNLRAMCARASGMCHAFGVGRVSKHSVEVWYSNPDEYGSDCPVLASFPVYRSHWKEDEDNPRVVLDVLRVTGGRDAYDREGAWQAIEGAVVLGTTVWRTPEGEWMTHADLKREGPDRSEPARDPCTVCDL